MDDTNTSSGKINTKINTCTYETEIIITGQFEGFHMWPGAPDEVSFLRNKHRHIFTVSVGMPVTHNDRQREFFTEKKKLQPILDYYAEGKAGHSFSCEMVAEGILNRMPYASWAEVFEDGENGACVTKEIL